MKKMAVAFALVGLMALGGQAFALICTVDDVPAATLLLPYFEVDLVNPNGVTTLFSVNNASATAVLAHVVVWTDLSVPVLDFNIYLTGYDVQTINMRDILNGTLPRTASDGQDPTDTISPQGDFSQDINFASCTGQLPIGPLGADFVDYLRRSLTGQAIPPGFPSAGLCAGRNLGDNIARGYVTVDTVNSCTLRFPNVRAYFDEDVTDQNVLWGDYFYVNTGQNFAQGETLVHIEASPGAGTSEFNTYGPPDPGFVPGDYTFYGRYVGWDGSDGREPLATNFATRYVLGGDFNGGTNLVVWRDAKVNQAAVACPAGVTGRPAWYPLGQEAIVIFDEQEQPNVPEGSPVSPPRETGQLTPFPAEAQRTVIGGPNFPVPFNFGWLYLNLNTTVTAAGANPPEDPAAAQAWVTTVMDAQGRFSVGFDAIKLDSACDALHFSPGD